MRTARFDSVVAASIAFVTALVMSVPGAWAEKHCPDTLRFEADQESSDLDVGWTGRFHDQRVDFQFTMAVSCPGAPPNCGACTLSGPVANPCGGCSSYNRRCSGNIAIQCTVDADCGVDGPCSFLVAPLPLSAGGVAVCVVNEIAGAETGTLDVETGSMTATIPLQARVYSGASVDAPCPQCIAGTCAGGARSGAACSTGCATSGVFGKVSLDCPPVDAALIGSGVFPFPPLSVLSTGTQVRTLSATNPACRAGGFGGSKCLCDTCNNLAATPCSTNADCTVVGATVCGGKRCQGSGGNAGSPCTVSGDCTNGGVCGVPGLATAPNQCSGVCSSNTPPDEDSINEGQCDDTPELFCGPSATFAGCSGDAECAQFNRCVGGTNQGAIGCTADSNCPGGTCEIQTCSVSKTRECFTDNGMIGGTISVRGVAHPPVANIAHAVLGDLGCVGPTGSNVVNATAGLPGPSRLTLPGTMTLCGTGCDEEGDVSEADEDQDVTSVVGNVSDLYPAFDTTTDTWYPGLTCPPAIGTIDDPEDQNTDEEEDEADMAECRLACQGGTNDGTVCSLNTVGCGPGHGHPCAVSSECPGGVCGPPTCRGGTNDGTTCTVGSECPGGVCLCLQDATDEEVDQALEDAEAMIADKVAIEPLPAFQDAGPVGGGPYTPPATPHLPDPNGCYVFGGRDIVFVHGLHNSSLRDALGSGTGGDDDGLHPDFQSAREGWEPPTSFPANSAAGLTNPHDSRFYRDGYWKKGAEQYWEKHIDHFLTQRGIKNRYLIVAWASPQRLEIGAHAVLTQISDAMRFGEGVVNPANPADTVGFGTPSFVIISHSTGAPVADVAMTAAELYPNLNAQFIPALAKAHIAFAGAFSGSGLASMALETSIPLVCRLGRGSAPFDPCASGAQARLFGSVLLDLAPQMMQAKWHDFIDQTPVRTLTVVGGHPSAAIRFVKHHVHLGYDDGVLTVNSQVASPNPAANWPSGKAFTFSKRLLLKDALTRKRRQGYFRDHVRKDPKRSHPAVDNLISSAAIPYLTPTGMVVPQDLGAPAPDSDHDPLARYQNHFSFIQAASDHFGSTPGSDRTCKGGDFAGAICSDSSECKHVFSGGGDGECKEGYYKNNDDWTGPDDYIYDFKAGQYASTCSNYFGAFTDDVTTRCIVPVGINNEETRAITDNRVYDLYTSPCSPNNGPCYMDNQSLLHSNDPGIQMVEDCQGRPKRGNKKPCGGGGRWKWERKYHRLKGWETKVAADYVYGYVLAGTPAPSCDCVPPTSLTDRASSCLAAIAKGSSKFVAKKLKAKQKCINKNLQTPGDCPQFVIDAIVAALHAKLDDDIAKKCVNVGFIGYPGRCVDSTPSDGFTLSDIQTCMYDSHETAVDKMLDLEYGTTAWPIPTSVLGCQKALAQSAGKFLNAKLKAIQKCRNGLNRGKLFGVPCESCATGDPKTSVAIAKADSKARATIAAKCSDSDISQLHVCSPNATTTLGAINCLLQAHGDAVDSSDPASASSLIDYEYADPPHWR